jgi:hypothetical protein
MKDRLGYKVKNIHPIQCETILISSHPKMRIETLYLIWNGV